MAGRGFLIGAAVAAGALMLVPGVAAAVARAGRPLLREALRTGATAWDGARKAGAEAYEHFEDMAAEVRADMAAAADAPDVAPGNDPAPRAEGRAGGSPAPGPEGGPARHPAEGGEG